MAMHRQGDTRVRWAWIASVALHGGALLAIILATTTSPRPERRAFTAVRVAPSSDVFPSTAETLPEALPTVDDTAPFLDDVVEVDPPAAVIELAPIAKPVAAPLEGIEIPVSLFRRRRSAAPPPAPATARPPPVQPQPAWPVTRPHARSAPQPLRVLFAPDPRRYYPLPALREGRSGSVWVRITIDEQGRVTHALVDRSSGDSRLDRAALALARAYRFGPAGAVRRTRLPVHFRLDRRAL